MDDPGWRHAPVGRDRSRRGRPPDLNATNRLTLSARFGFNISGKFTGAGSAFSSGVPLAAGRRTPDGDPYNYDNGYVLPKYGGSNPQYPYTWYWGYDAASQVNAGAQNIGFDRTIATGLPSETASDDSSYVGAELTWTHELGRNETHRLSYGFEAAFNFMPIDFNSGGLSSATLSRSTDTFGYTSGTTPPGYTDPSQLPYQGTFQGPGFVIGDSPSAPPVTTSVPGATFLAQQQFDSNLWGFRLGPYLEYLLSDKWNLRLVGGLAVGLLDAQANWQETLTLPASLGGGALNASGQGNDLSVLWGFYAGLDVGYQFSKSWGVEVGAQFQDLGVYNHDFGGRTAELDLSSSIFVHAGITWTF
jgi:hypothetical protein